MIPTLDEIQDKQWHNTVCLDWDGVIEVFPHVEPPQPIPGAVTGLLGLLDGGWYIEIYSGGSNDPARLSQMKQNLDDWTRDPYGNTLREFAGDRINFALTKPTAKVYVDDRGWQFTTWEMLTPDNLESFRAWWQSPESKR